MINIILPHQGLPHRQITIGKLTPIFTALLAALLIAEPLTWAIGAFSLLAIAGVVLVAHPPFLMGGHEAWSSTRMAGAPLQCCPAGDLKHKSGGRVHQVYLL